MHPEKPPETIAFEDCDLNSIFKIIEKDTQTNEAAQVRNSGHSAKTYKLPLPRDLEKQDEGSIKLFSFCQVIQDPECPTSVTIVRESVTEEAHTHTDENSNKDGVSNRYRYCKEVIKPYLKDYPPDCPDSGELLIRDAIEAANEEFPEYPPCFEISEPIDENKDKELAGESEKSTLQCESEIQSELVEDITSELASPETPGTPTREKYKLCPNETIPKICIEITDPKLCPPCHDSKEPDSDKCVEEHTEKRSKSADFDEDGRCINPCSKKHSKENIKNCNHSKDKRNKYSKENPRHCDELNSNSKRSDSKHFDKSSSRQFDGSEDKSYCDSPCPYRHSSEDKKNCDNPCPHRHSSEDKKYCDNPCPHRHSSEDKKYCDNPCPHRHNREGSRSSNRSCSKKYSNCPREIRKTEEDTRSFDSSSEQRFSEHRKPNKYSKKEERSSDCLGSNRYSEVPSGKKYSREDKRHFDGSEDKKYCEDEDHPKRRSKEDTRSLDRSNSKRYSKELACFCPDKYSEEDSRSYDCSEKRNFSDKHSREDCKYSKNKIYIDRSSINKHCGESSEKEHSNENCYCEEPEKNKHSFKKVLPPREYPPQEPNEECCSCPLEDPYPPKLHPSEDEVENCYCTPKSKEDNFSSKSGKETNKLKAPKPDHEIILSHTQAKQQKSDKNAWPPSSEDVNNLSNKGVIPPPKKDCLTRLLESFTARKDSETCTQTTKSDTTKTDDTTKSKMDRDKCIPKKKCSNEMEKDKNNSNKKSTNPCPSGIPLDISSKNSKSDSSDTNGNKKNCIPRNRSNDMEGRPCTCPEEMQALGKITQCKEKQGKGTQDQGKGTQDKGKGTHDQGKGTQEQEKIGEEKGSKAGNSAQSQQEQRKTAMASATSASNRHVCSPSDGKPPIDLKAHTETLATIKCAMEDFCCKVYRSTTDAVSCLASESAKQFEKLTKCGSKTDPPPPKQVCDSRSREKLRRLSLVNMNAIPDFKDDDDDSSISPAKIYKDIVTKVSSTATLISDTLNFDLPTGMRPRSFNDVSSKYDKPLPKDSPQDVECILSPAGTSNMFDNLKEKMWTLFCEEDNVEHGVASTESSTTSRESITTSTGSVSSEDENLINKLID